VRDFARPLTDEEAKSTAVLFDSLPHILAANTLRAVAQHTIEAKAKNCASIWGLGGHVIKTGLAPILIDLMRRGFVIRPTSRSPGPSSLDVWLILELDVHVVPRHEPLLVHEPRQRRVDVADHYRRPTGCRWTGPLIFARLRPLGSGCEAQTARRPVAAPRRRTPRSPRTFRR